SLALLVVLGLGVQHGYGKWHPTASSRSLVPRRDARALQIRPDFWSARIRLKTLRIAMMKI
ncbi:MAG: hypothetical protein ACK53Y_03680, partial [bacterium]